jgi:hypothetical protein
MTQLLIRDFFSVACRESQATSLRPRVPHSAVTVMVAQAPSASEVKTGEETYQSVVLRSFHTIDILLVTATLHTGGSVRIPDVC